MKIGIACTTFNRPAHLEMWTKMVAEHSPEDAVFHIANDTKDRKGVAFRKTECLRELYNAGCDYFFIFDDDTFPIEKGWCDFFIDAMKASGQNHFCYLKETPGVRLISSIQVKGATVVRESQSNVTTAHLSDQSVTINRFDNCNGCLMVLTRLAVEKVGAFNPNFKMYGYEHADYSNRVHFAGLNSIGAFLCPAGAERFIYSCDLDYHRPEIQRKLKHKSSMHPTEALHHVSKAQEVFKKSNQIHWPL